MRLSAGVSRGRGEEDVRGDERAHLADVETASIMTTRSDCNKEHMSGDKGGTLKIGEGIGEGGSKKLRRDQTKEGKVQAKGEEAATHLTRS